MPPLFLCKLLEIKFPYFLQRILNITGTVLQKVVAASQVLVMLAFPLYEGSLHMSFAHQFCA